MRTNKTFPSKLLTSWKKLGPGLVTGACDDLEKVTDTDTVKNPTIANHHFKNRIQRRTLV